MLNISYRLIGWYFGQLKKQTALLYWKNYLHYKPFVLGNTPENVKIYTILSNGNMYILWPKIYKNDSNKESFEFL